MRPASHRVIVPEQCCATCRHLRTVAWLCGWPSTYLPPPSTEAGFVGSFIRQPQYEVCDEWEKRDA